MCPVFISNVLGIYEQFCSKVQKYYLRSPETSLKKARNNPEKLRENKNSAASTDDRTEEPRDRWWRPNHNPNILTYWWFVVVGRLTIYCSEAQAVVGLEISRHLFEQKYLYILWLWHRSFMHNFSIIFSFVYLAVFIIISNLN